MIKRLRKLANDALDAGYLDMAEMYEATASAMKMKEAALITRTEQDDAGDGAEVAVAA